jgi:6-pyruvoyltetrahydropterin/6-carboxytetrahydropterin synthase
MAASLSRVVGFRALHRMYRADWSEARNREVFGALSDAPGHPHDYRCIVTVTGPLEAGRGMVMDLVALDRILDEEVVRRFDGRNLNEAVPEFADGSRLATCEALASYVFGRVAPRLPGGVRLERVRMLEDPTLYADCTGD